MKYENKFFLLLLFNLIISSFSQYIKNDEMSNNLIENNNYKSISKDEFINITFDIFVFGNINYNSTINYQITIKNDSEQIFFDFQSEYGCLYVIIDEVALLNSSYHYMFCSEGRNNIFTLSKNEIIETIGDNKTISNSGLNLIIKIGLSKFEIEYENINFDYSLKVSAKKQIINIIEINSEHKTLCELEKVNSNSYRCLFVVIVNENNGNISKDNMIIYSTSQSKETKLNIYADYINKTIYENYNIEYLKKSIPNINSTYSNNNNELDFINILSLESDKYIYISVESNSKSTIEIIAQKVLSDEIKVPLKDNIQINKISKNIANIYFNFKDSTPEDISLSLVTLYGKANIYLGYDNSREYITDIIENKLILSINKSSCYSDGNNCKLVIRNLNQKDTEGLGYIFYISFKIKSMNNLKELTYGKSNKILFTDFKFPILLYEQLPNINTPININLQIYNIPEINLINDNYDVEILVLSKKELYQIQLNYSYIKKFKNSVKSIFDPILSSANILLSVEDMNTFDIIDDPFLLIYINNNNIYSLNKLILGSTISQINSLIYPSERIYHYGKLDNEEKIVYKLKGKSEYHLMRLEFGSNSGLVDWSVKRTNERNNDNYRKNDTDLSFVSEKWINGRELLTIYIEHGEDIYLTVFTKNRITNSNLTNFIFKYVNAEKNDDFQNHIIKHSSLNYDQNSYQIGLNKIKIIPQNSAIVYYLKIINESDYLENENINIIAIMKSKSTLLLKENENNNYNIMFNITDYIFTNYTYYINAYAVIIENNNNIEYISFSGTIIKFKNGLKISRNTLIMSSFIICCCTALILLISLIRYCIYCNRYRRYSYIDHDFIHPFDYNYHLEDIDDEDEDLYI